MGYFMVPSDAKYGGDKPQVAKGRIDPGESQLVAAIREGEEELGLVAENIKWLEKVGQSGDLMFYVAEVEDINNFGKYCYETGSTHWLSLEEFLQIGRNIQKSIVVKAFEIARNRNANMGHSSQR